jgi:hypothetical protein
MNLNAFLDFFNTFFHVSESMQRVGVGRLQYRIFVIENVFQWVGY